MMQLGFVSAILPDLSLEEVVEFAAESGYGCVEVMCWPPGKANRRYAGVTHIDITDFGSAQANRVLVVEAMVLATKAGIDPQLVIDAVSNST